MDTSTRQFDAYLQEEAQVVAEQLKVIEQEYEHDSSPSPESRYHYGWVLSKSTSRRKKDQGIRMIEDLIDEGFHVAECHHTLAVAHYLDKRWAKSRHHCEMALRLCPDSIEIPKLHHHILKQLEKDSLTAVGIYGGAAMVAGGAGGGAGGPAEE
eukprot:CAMPEP_0113936348 /NCGR_PEP_ID=MMETSP1339-20121228/3281_1 /TAXON_ID=94617 /ORGANISM="Fibrocapsa japonica" /LENGTH=153 /DNA_ID=CAMNT_0000938793 /DNA_START=106 /DNA_END=566 /DNA_ORIENTATION=- /assembly_acc=CAM_ASM_000762